MKVSVALATYNGAKYLNEQLESISKQSHKPDELIVSDDCSEDETRNIVLDFVKTAPFKVQLFVNNKNKGYRENFLSILQKVTGDIVFFSDQDDVWFEEKIEKHLSIYNNDKKALVVISNQEIVGPDLEKSGRTTLEEFIRRRGDNQNFVHGCCTSFHSSILNIARRPGVNFAHDDWVHAVAESCNGRRVLPATLQLFRRHESTTTKSDFNSFEMKAKRGRKIGASEVAKALRRRERDSAVISASLKSSKELPVSVRDLGVQRCDNDALIYGKRAARLENPNIISLVGVLLSVLKGELSFKQGGADVMRIINQLSAYNNGQSV